MQDSPNPISVSIQCYPIFEAIGRIRKHTVLTIKKKSRKEFLIKKFKTTFKSKVKGFSFLLSAQGVGLVHCNLPSVVLGDQYVEKIKTDY